jgi:hypothetical protein
MSQDWSRSWYATSFRKLFFDFHSSEGAVGLGADFDAEGWADRLVEAGAQAVSVFAKCGFGWSFYRRGAIRYVHPHLPAGLDMLDAQMTSLHRRGLKAIGYYHCFNSEPMAREFPDWRCLDVNGEPRDTMMCLQSPLFEGWMLPHVEEIVSNYDVDAMFFDGPYAHSVCYCAACRRRFHDEMGEPDLPSGPDDPAWLAFVEWSLVDYRRIREQISAAIHRHRPDMPVSFNWCYTMRMPEVVPPHVGSLMLDIYPDDQCFNGSYEARHWATIGRPFDIMNSAFLQWWGDWSCKPAVALQHEVATAIANGGLTWIGYQMTHTFEVQPAVMAELAKTLAFVREREPLLVGATPKAAVAVLNSTNTYFTDAPRFWIDEVPLRGAHKVFMESGLPHHFVDEDRLLASLRDYSVVVLSDQRRLSDDLVAALTAYVNDGGGLLVTGRTGTLDASLAPTGELALADLLGIELAGEYEGTLSYLVVTDPSIAEPSLPMPHMMEAPALLVRPAAPDVGSLADLVAAYVREDGKPLLRWSPPGEPTGHPAITFRRVGNGAVAYIASDIFRAYQVKNVWPLKNIIVALTRRLARELPVSVTAPAWLEVALAEQPATGGTRTIVHLVNHHGNRSIDNNFLCIEASLPVRDVVVTVPRKSRPAGVTLEPGGLAPEWDWDGKQVTVRVPEVAIHTAVVVA